MTSAAPFSSALGIRPGIIAVVGGGGKTSLIEALACELSTGASVVICTTTHMWLPKCHTLLSPKLNDICIGLREHNPVAVGTAASGGKLAPPAFAIDALLPLADYILVEADGSRGLPAKAPAEHEPCIPKAASHVVAVFGLDALHRPIAEAAHRPKLYADIAGVSVDTEITEQVAANVLSSERGQLKGVECTFSVFLNKADDANAVAAAERLAASLNNCAVVIGSIWRKTAFHYKAY